MMKNIINKLKKVFSTKKSIENNFLVVGNNNSIFIDLSEYAFNPNFSEEKSFIDNIYDYIFDYSFGKSNLRITKRVLQNGDYFLYFEGSNCPNIKFEISLPNDMQHHNFDEHYKVPPYDNRFGENKTTFFAYYLDSMKENGSFLFTKVYYYKKLYKEYEMGQSEVLDLEKESLDTVIIGNKAFIDLKSYSNDFCFTIMVSKEKMFVKKDNLKEYINYFFESLYSNSVWSSFFLRPSGTFTKLPYSIEPFTKEGYGWSLHHSSRKDLVRFFESTSERFFYNMIANAILQAYMYNDHQSYIFYTPYTSTWLKKDTGITAPYIDTRLNETFAHMLYDFLPKSEFNNKIDPYENYAEFLYGHYKLGEQVYKTANGVFFADYYKEGLGRKTHTSLNHQLGMIQVFERAFKKNGNKEYLTVIKSIVNFIEDTKEQWINPETGDLFYGIKESESGFVFHDSDYIYVTLYDLLNTQVIYFSNFGKMSESISYLVKKKVAYLETTPYDVFNENAKNPPHENINSRMLVLKLIEKQYPELIKGK